jgi:hypothetical protein
MVEQIPTHAGPGPQSPGRGKPALHVAGDEDQTKAQRLGDLFDAILVRGDLRDQAAERRDRRADARAPLPGDAPASLDRIWSGMDRDSAAVDRAALVDLLRAQQALGRTSHTSVDQAKAVLVARFGCTPEQALLDLREAAAQQELTIDELAACIVADQGLL